MEKMSHLLLLTLNIFLMYFLDYSQILIPNN